MATVLEQEMHDYFKQLNDSEKKSIILLLKTFLIGRKESTHISIEQYNKEIDEAISRVEDGEFNTQDEVEKMSKEW